MTKRFFISLWFTVAASSTAASDPQSQLIAATDNDRGCCVIISEPIRCAATNRGYCRQLATKQDIQYRFHENARCANVAACPALEGQANRLLALPSPDKALAMHQ